MWFRQGFSFQQKKEIVFWLHATHESCAIPQGAPAPGTLGQIMAPSDLTLNALNDALVQVKKATID